MLAIAIHALPLGGEIGAPPLATRSADPPKVDVEELRARFVARFPTYIEWPTESLPEPTTPLVIATIDSPALATELRSIFDRWHARAKKAREEDPQKPLPRPVEVRSHLAGEITADPSLLAGCHVVYLGNSVVATAAKKILARLANSPTLTISDRLAGNPRATAIELVLEKSKLRIAIRRSLLRSAGLRASSKLLRLAELLPGPNEGKNR